MDHKLVALVVAAMSIKGDTAHWDLIVDIYYLCTGQQTLVDQWVLKIDVRDEEMSSMDDVHTLVYQMSNLTWSFLPCQT